MRLRRLKIENFGPFRRYALSFPVEDAACVLLTGKNNEGKSSIISALKLINAATRVVGSRRQRMLVNRDERFKLLQQDTENLPIRRLIHNYGDEPAHLTAELDDGFEITVSLDPAAELAFAGYEGRIPTDLQDLFGFIPPLGPLSETEEILSRDSYLRASLNTSLAPRHLRNHLARLLSRDEYALVQEIVRDSWEEIELLDFEVRHGDNQINCYYRERRTDREISWAGQGLQVWFQIVAHLVRLRNSKILVLDEPEINLHPEKQNELLRIIRDHIFGSVIIATHSVELMNNVSVSHILNVQKRTTGPKVKSTADRAYLEVVRSQIGSSFNLIASQFEDCDVVIFTEDVFDFSVLRELARVHKLSARVFNIPIHGFSEYKKASSYKDAYRLLIGKEVKWSMLLDRDHYPSEYLEEVKDDLASHGIRLYLTPGKEIENMLVTERALEALVPPSLKAKFKKNVEKLFERERVDTWGSLVTLHQNFLPKRVDPKTVTKTYMPAFEKTWNDPRLRWNLVSGKTMLSFVRDFMKRERGEDVPLKLLCELAEASKDEQTRKLIRALYFA